MGLTKKTVGKQNLLPEIKHLRPFHIPTTFKLTFCKLCFLKASAIHFKVEKFGM